MSNEQETPNEIINSDFAETSDEEDESFSTADNESCDCRCCHCSCSVVEVEPTWEFSFEVSIPVRSAGFLLATSVLLLVSFAIAISKR